MARSHKILLVDDEQIMHDLAQAYLERAGYDLISAFTGESGLRAVIEEKPDVVLLDYMMAGINGEEAFRRLRYSPEFHEVRDTPVIFLTAKGGEDELKQRLINKGASACLKKPFGLRELSNLLENIFIIADVRKKNRRLENEIRATKEHLEHVIQNAPVGIITTDAQGKILESNPKFNALVSSQPDEKLSEDAVATHSVVQGSFISAGVKAVLESKSTWTKELFHWTLPNGENAVLNARFVPMKPQSDAGNEGVIGLVEDVSEREHVQHQRNMLAQISMAMQDAFDVDSLIHLILTATTAGQGLGFKRALFFLADPKEGKLVGKMGVGPKSRADALRIWDELEQENLSLREFLAKYGHDRPAENHPVNRLARSSEFLLTSSCPVIQKIRGKGVFRGQAADLAKYEDGLPTAEELDLQDFIAAPLVANNRLLGMIVCDNKFDSKPINKGQIELLIVFAGQAANLLDRARAHTQLNIEKRKLEHAYEALRDTQDRLIRSEQLAAIGEMAAHVAHEIRNPLVTIGGFARQLVKKAGRIHQRNMPAEIIADEVLRLEKILENVLNFTKLPRPEKGLFRMNQTVKSVCEQVQNGFEQNNIDLQIDLEAANDEFFFDEAQVRQVLLNLLRNSEQSINANGLVRIDTKNRNDDFVLTIADNGGGIPPDKRKVIFNPFFTTKKHGTGLGLAISQRIINDHGGEITVISEVGHGTVFRIALPMETTDYSSTNGRHSPYEDIIV